MVLCDYFSKWLEAYVLLNHTAQTLANRIVTDFVVQFGVPQQLHSDQGREFESDLFQEICKLLDMDKTRTVPYRHQSDGQSGGAIQSNITANAAMFVNEFRDDWDDHLPHVLMAYRASVQESTGCMPNLLFLGRELSLPIDLMFGQPPVRTLPDCPIAYVEWVKQATQSAFEFACNNLKDSAVRQEKLYNRRSDIKQLNPGDWVGGGIHRKLKRN